MVAAQGLSFPAAIVFIAQGGIPSGNVSLKREKALDSMPPTTVKNQKPKNQKKYQKPALSLKKDAMPASRINRPIMQPMRLWIPVAVSMAFIFYFSSIPAKDIPSLFLHQDIVFHIFVYTVLCFFFARALKNTSCGILAWKLILLTVIFGTFYGVTDEFHQSFVPGRSVSGFDILMDSVGSFIGSLIYR